VVVVACSLGGSAPHARAADALSTIARDAYVFTFPLYETYRVRYQMQYSPANPRRVPPNQFLKVRTLADSTSRRVTTPNNDTLYCSAFLDLSRGPLLFEAPEIADRYYSFAFMDFYTNNFSYIGTRTTGPRAGRYLIVGPGWSGPAPEGARVLASPTNAVWLLGRFLVSDPSDLPQVHQLQDAVKLSPLLPGATVPAFDGPPIVPDDPWNYFAVVNHALTQNPPPARDTAIVSRMAAIGVGPGRTFDGARFDDKERQELLAGIQDAKRLIAAEDLGGKVVNGWAYPPRDIGNFGEDYLRRAATALKGLGAVEPAEATYLSHVGEALDGSRTYRLRFDRDRLPPVAAFWSLSIYEVMPDKRRFFADNPIHRYSIGDRTPRLQRSADGSLEIYIQHASPGAARESNWLPAPPGPFALILRGYLPRAPLLDGTYAPPPLERTP